MIGVFEKGYIDTIETNETKQEVAVAEGYIDEMRYKNLVRKLETEINNGNTVSGSVELIGLPENEHKIIYRDGWKPEGRIAQDFLYGGWAMLGIRPASPIATVIEINNKPNQEGETTNMDEKILMQFISDMKDGVKNTLTEINSHNETYETKIDGLNTQIIELESTISEVNTTVETLTTELNGSKEAFEAKIQEVENLTNEITSLKSELEKAKINEKKIELNSALSVFTDDEKFLAKSDIDAFEADPISVEINSIVTKIQALSYQKIKEAQKVSETNASNNQTNVEDIFSDVVETNSNSTEDDSIF